MKINMSGKEFRYDLNSLANNRQVEFLGRKKLVNSPTVDFETTFYVDGALARIVASDSKRRSPVAFLTMFDNYARLRVDGEQLFYDVDAIARLNRRYAARLRIGNMPDADMLWTAYGVLSQRLPNDILYRTKSDNYTFRTVATDSRTQESMICIGGDSGADNQVVLNNQTYSPNPQELEILRTLMENVIEYKKVQTQNMIFAKMSKSKNRK